jgi:hypothetical protein
MKSARPLLLAVGLALLVPLPLAAQTNNLTETDKLVMNTSGFMGAHPDMRFRLLGLKEYRKQNYTDAMTYFRRAARYADKPSQGMIAEMLWKGQGVPVDRPAAYIWMDLAAERGYTIMLAQREQYWAALDESERSRALEIGDALHEEFSDAAAKPRLAQKLRLAKRSVTGSRTGAVGALRIEIPTPGGSRTIDGSDYYDDKYWEPHLYWRMQDGDWREVGEGKVDVGDVQAAGNLSVPEGTDTTDEADDTPR